MSQGSQGQDAADGAEITWVGEQRLMQGYCGRATATAVPATPVAAAEPAGETTGRAGRPIATVRGRSRRREMIVRVAPPRDAEDVSAPLEAA